MRHVTRDQVIGYRLQAHGLRERRAESPAAVSARCGLQDSPPGSGLLALHARADGVGPGTVDDALEGRTLLRTWSLRGAPYLIPTDGAAVYTTGVLPAGDAATRHFILGAGPSLDALEMSADEAVEATAAAVRRVLRGRRLAIGALGAEVAQAIAPELTAAQRKTWESEGPHAPGQPVGEAIVHFCVRILTLRGIVCFAPREDGTAPFVLVDEWLGHPLPEIPTGHARTELVRRFLRCHGPATRAGFAAWLGVRSGDAAPWWSLLADEIEPVDLDGRRTWVHVADAESLDAAPDPAGTRLLPPHDPYTRVTDRDTIVAPEHQRAVWRTVGDPGALLLDGRIAGTWRPRKRGDRLGLTVETFAPLPRRARTVIEEEAHAVGRVRGATAMEVAFTGP
ncbi:winged helix DNA-binding domain-containing protein [Tsukamurella sp. 1534]|uniref:winged helix DNA-binding domain-containing protein n=1 Tax=Tsukamurella sp. 1534 TaxID=1151061 RepID=UPI0002F3BED7|nr:winged helix DNA-binding domain-containing protein [Tsukamurella sp. 1534]